MSKERLEEIKQQLEESNSYDDNPNGYWYRNINWLIEQAERVQELDELVLAYQTELSIKDNANKRNKKKNKRYREAREIIEQVYKENYVRNAYGYEDGYLDGLDTAISIIDKALGELE